ncbi:MAG: hypothetical protein KDK33_02055 [Leptospiraceae bacterium]|nr:hypothetical protein [Leptospiraceae bacterium]
MESKARAFDIEVNKRSMEKESLELRRNWIFRHLGQRLLLAKRPRESSEHVFLKAFLWALFHETYPGLEIEKSIGDRYKPDAICLAHPTAPHEARKSSRTEMHQRAELSPELSAGGLPDLAVPIFWAEAGQVKMQKIRSILSRFHGLHFVIARWGFRKEPLIEQIRSKLGNDPRIRKKEPRVELLQFDSSAHIRSIAGDGTIQLDSDDYRIHSVL